MTPRTPETTPLALIPNPTAQQVFDAVVAHAKQMPGRCHELGGCRYRSSDNTNACFVGGLLTDEEAMGLDAGVPKTASDLTEKGLMPDRLIEHTDLLQRLQEVHDLNNSPASWPLRLRKAADAYGLDASSVDLHFGADED